jgi:hypothetical protein
MSPYQEELSQRITRMNRQPSFVVLALLLESVAEVSEGIIAKKSSPLPCRCEQSRNSNYI